MAITRGKPVTCPECGRRFKNAAGLSGHLRQIRDRKAASRDEIGTQLADIRRVLDEYKEPDLGPVLASIKRQDARIGRLEGLLEQNESILDQVIELRNQFQKLVRKPILIPIISTAGQGPSTKR